MFRILCLTIGLGLSSTAFANLEVAAFAQGVQTRFNSDISGVDYSANTGTKVGGLLLFPILPGFSLRTGLIHHQRKIAGDITTTSPKSQFSYEDKLTEIPLNLQVGLPVTSLYLFGGLIYSTTSSSSCSASGAGAACSSDKTPSDTLMNLGVGYDVISIALFRLGLELEFAQGTKNLSTGAGDLKQSSMGLGVVGAFGF